MDEQFRADLHRRLDGILQTRVGIERLEQGTSHALSAFSPRHELANAESRRQARQLFREALVLLLQAVGPTIHEATIPTAYREDKEQRQLLKMWLFELYPVIQLPIGRYGALSSERQLTYFDVMDALSALDAGEVRPIFVANTGKNRRANRYSLARTKVEALMWKKRLVALGRHEKEARFQVTQAFKEQWDTIRKWEKQCGDILGVEYVRAVLDTAGGERDLYMDTLRANESAMNALLGSVDASVAAAGEAYRRELQRSAELSKRKARANTDQ